MLASDNVSDILTLREAAALLDVHPTTLRRWEAQGRLMAQRLGSRGERFYTRQDVLRLAQSHSERVRESQRVVVEVARAISGSLDLHAVAQTVVEAAVRVVGSDRCAVYLLNAERTVFEPLAGIDVVDPTSAERVFYPTPLPIEAMPLLRYALDHAGPVVIPDAPGHPLGDPDLFRFFKTRTLISCGLRGAGGQVFALMTFVWSERMHIVRDDDVFFAQSLAELAEVALSNALLFTRHEQERVRATIISDVLRDVNSGRNLGDTLTRAAGSLVQQLHADRGSIWLIDASGEAIVGAAETHTDAASCIGATLSLPGSPNIARVVAEQRPALVTRDAALGDERAWFDLLDIRASLYVPLLTQGCLVGMAFVSYRQPPKPLHADDLHFAGLLAAQCALAIERAQLLEAERARAAELEAIFDAMTDSVIITDQDGRMRSYNMATVPVFGQQGVPDLPGRLTALNMRHADGQPLNPADAPTMRALRGEIVSNVELLADFGDGQEHTLLCSSAPIWDDHGRVAAAVNVTRDITVLATERRARLELAESYQRKAAELEAVISQMGEGVIVVDQSGRIRLCNQSARQLHGDVDLVGQRYGEAGGYRVCELDGAPSALADLPLNRALSGETVINAEWSICRADDSTVIVYGSAAPITGGDGGRAGAVAVLRDVTARRQLEDEKDQFLSVVSHELKTPLTTIKGLSELARRRLNRGAPVEDVLRNLESVARQVLRMEHLIGDLLDSQRLKTGVLPLNRAALDLTPVVREAYERGRGLTDQHQIELAVHSSEPLLVSADLGRIEQVLDNMLSNAIKYSPRHTTIRIELAREDSVAALRVHDEGIGIPAEGRERLFERFYRGSNVIASEYSGLGIGLALSREIAHRHGGTLALEATSPHGSTFTLRLPLL
jgi:PAS domain S-box-containing protein